jgi:hypothetical protein
MLAAHAPDPAANGPPPPAQGPARSGRIKGSVLHAALQWYAEAYGPDELRERVLPLRGQAAGDCLDVDAALLGTKAGVWYPAATIHALLELLPRSPAPDDVEAFARDVAAFAFERMSTGLHKMAFRMFIGPSSYPKHVQKLWSLNYDDGEVTVEVLGPGHHRATIRGWGSYHPLLFQIQNHYKRPVYELMGCSDVRFEVERDLGRGDPECVVHNRFVPP